MLVSLDIRDLALIDRHEMEFRPGLNVLTGETGAGKSILLDALGFALGWKGRGGTVRPGAAQGEVTATFVLAPRHPSAAILAEAGLAAGDELILRRTITADGRSTAFVNDRRTSAEMLRVLSGTLVELHGQHDDSGLLDARGHRRLLDDFAGGSQALQAVRAHWTDLGSARRALSDAEAALATVRAEEEFLRHAADELDRLSPEPGEDAVLDARRRLMQAAQRIRDDVARAAEALGSEGAEGRLIDARRWLDGAAPRAEGALDPALSAIDRALTELAEATGEVDRALDAMRFDPADLEAAEERLFAIRALARKHGVAPDDLGTFAKGLRERLERLDAGAVGLKALEARIHEAETQYRAASATLTAIRRQAATALDAAMATELPPLKLDRARFLTLIEPAEQGPDGADRVSFTVSTGPGLPPGPIDRIASGGELSRFLLALKVCLAAGEEPVTMIFDEIDRGVGGATADAVGRRLAALAGKAQVLVVTHSPQVAARGAHHWRVAKVTSATEVRSVVEALDAAGRVEEIARMLSGDQVTEAAREAARALIGG
jgi:DNA repair protein RecN (Recombination protein N)